MPSKNVAEIIASYPAMVQQRLRVLRGLIYDTAKSNHSVGPITETLKWGEPAYLTEAAKFGSTIRIGRKPSKPDQHAMYFNCLTTLAEDFRTLLPERASKATGHWFSSCKIHCQKSRRYSVLSWRSPTTRGSRRANSAAREKTPWRHTPC
jgi:hypothetical protein